MSDNSISPMKLIVLLILGAILSSPEKSSADLYAYIDESGVHHFTNVPTNPRYRLVERKTFSPLLSHLISKYDQKIHAISHQYQIDPNLVRSIIKVESGFNPVAISVKGAQGLMQLMPGTAQGLKVTNPFNPQENIRGGVRYLRYLLDLFHGDLVLALAAYNAGETAVLRYQSVPPYPETLAYIQKVMALYDPSLESQLIRNSGKNTTRPERGKFASSPGSSRQNNKIYKQYRNFDGERILVYTNIPVSRHPGMGK